MEGVVSWLSDKWPEAVSALAALATLIIVLSDKVKKREIPIDLQLRLGLDRATGLYLATLTVQRPAFGQAEIETLSTKGWDIALRENTGTNIQPVFAPPPSWGSSINPGWRVDMYGQHQSALFWFWARPSSSSRSRTAQNVMRLKLRISLKSARSLTSTMTVISNRID